MRNRVASGILDLVAICAAEAVVLRLPHKAAALTIFCLIPLAYYILPEWLLGATLGKAIAGLQVVRLDYRTCDFWAVLQRNALRLIDLFYLGWAVALLSASRRRLGDYLGRTIVVHWPIATSTRVLLMLGWIALASTGFACLFRV